MIKMQQCVPQLEFLILSDLSDSPNNPSVHGAGKLSPPRVYVRSNSRPDDSEGNRKARRCHAHTHPHYPGKDPDQEGVMVLR